MKEANITKQGDNLCAERNIDYRSLSSYYTSLNLSYKSKNVWWSRIYFMEPKVILKKHHILELRKCYQT